MMKEANGEKILTRLTLGGSETSPAATPGKSPRRHERDETSIHSASRAWAKSVSSASPPPSRSRSTTRPASAFAIFRSYSTSCCEGPPPWTPNDTGDNC